MKKETYKKLAVVTIFAIAMAFIETLIVVYLRKIYYPTGFSFPLNLNIEQFVLNIEWIREFFTIVMLICIGILAAKKFHDRFAYFLYSFAIWDIFYYIWLKVILNWPESFFTWDLLFLIPIPWLSPVLAPIICSITMIILAITILYLSEKKSKVYLNKYEWILLILGALIVLYTFLYDFSKLIIQGGFLSRFFNLLKDPEFMIITQSYIPINYNWIIFIIGEIFMIVSIILFYKRTKSLKK